MEALDSREATVRLSHTVRLTADERERLQRAADIVGVSFSEFLRVAALAFARRAESTAVTTP